jgi:very-short-patch-repair endonuclease
MRTATVRDLSEYDEVIWFADVPQIAGSHSVTHDDQGSDGEWIALERPRVSPRPPLPSLLWDWLADEQVDATAEPRLRDLGESEALPDDVGPEFEDYLSNWRRWAAEHAVKLPLLGLYERLFRVKQQADQLGERYEVVAGVGLILAPSTDHGRVRRHGLTMRVEIQYEAQSGRIAVRPAPDGMHLQFEDEMLDPAMLPGKALRDAVMDSLIAAGADIWKGGVLTDALMSWTQAMRHDAVFSPAIALPQMPSSGLLVALAPALILRRRTTRSLLSFYQAVDDQLQAGADVPSLVAGLVAEPEGHIYEGEHVDLDTEDELYFPRPYNRQQLEVLRRLETSAGVVVVGPPGTGKSHTIANLVSHLLAHGQRVLVTSHTSRALEVLLDKLPDEIRNLSVSLVGDGRAGMRELQHSVEAIVQRSTDPEWYPTEIEQRISRLTKGRARAEEERRRHLAAIRAAREGDAQVHDTGFGGYHGTLSVIAARVASERPLLGWASDMQGASPALKDDEATELMRLVRAISPDVETSTRAPLPDLDGISDDRFAEMCRRRLELGGIVADVAAQREHPETAALSAASHDARLALVAAVERMERARRSAAAGEPWEVASFEEVLAASAADWRERAVRTTEWIETLRRTAPLADQLTVVGSLGAEPTVARAAAQSLLERLQAGKGLGFGPLKPRVVRDARAAFGTLRIDGQEPLTPAVLQRFLAWVDTRLVSDRASLAWQRERHLRDASPYALLAHLEELSPAAGRVLAAEECRREVTSVLALMPEIQRPSWSDSAAWTSLRRATQAVDAEANYQAVLDEFAALRRQVEDIGGTEPGDLVPETVAAIDAADPRAFATVRVKVLARRGLRQQVARRDELAARLRTGLPNLTLEELAGDEEDWSARFERFEAAFWRSRAESWLREMLDASTGGAASRVSVLSDEIRALTASIGEHLAWKRCLGSLTKAQSMHLTLYQQAMRKYGRGMGKFSSVHLAAAQRELEACRAAVPAWIMPTYRVAESLRPVAEAFDVVIVDEASQSGVDALFLWWLGKKVVIVGDDEQISPDAVGLELEPVFALRNQLLSDQPIGSVVSPTTSLFDLGQVAFPGKTYLREHFRCMPEIIAFSNRISYSNAPLEPLRQFGADRLPPLAVRHVAGATQTEGARGNVNRDEAHELVNTVLDCISKPEYEGRSMGVISLTGELQARYVERLLIQELGPDEMLRRRLKCGDAYAFQGDERDVMFLSMVAVPTAKGNRLPALTANTYRQRFNVAASRARDQMWLFHSVTQGDLNPDCLRWKLLEHFLHPQEQSIDPDLGVVTEDNPHRAFDSLFEQRVYLRVRTRGYRVLPQVSAYGYRIDLVVVGNESRLAVECDGDEWHGADVFERDLARQRDLERVGWRFVRIRESEFYLDPEAALRPLWARLAEVGIRPFGASTTEPAVEVEPSPEPLAESPDAESVVWALLEPFRQGQPAEVDESESFDEAPESVASPPAQVLVEGPVATPVPHSPTPSPNRQPAMAEYSAWVPRRIPDPRFARQPDLVETLVEVVTAEGPILAHRAYRLITQAAGGQRVTHAVVSPLNKACARAIRQGQLVATPSVPGAAWVNNVLRLPAQSEVVVRDRGPRDLEEIPGSEIREVVRMLRGRAGSAGDIDLKREILSTYGRTALTQAASRYLDQCLTITDVPRPEARPAQLPLPVRPTPAQPQPPVAIPRAAASPATAGTPAAMPPPAMPSASVDFVKVLTHTITRARTLSAGARSKLASEWRDDDVAEERRRVVEAAKGANAPRDWSIAARAVTATLEDWPAAARGAVVDSAYAQAAVGVPTDADVLLEPWRAAIEHRGTEEPVRAGPRAAERCPHGHSMGTCPFIACSGHFTGGMRLDEN